MDGISVVSIRSYPVSRGYRHDRSSLADRTGRIDGVQTLDLTGPLDAFGAANQARPGAYEVTIHSLDGSPFTSEAGMRISPAGALVDAPVLDTLIIAGGEGLRRGDTASRLASAIMAHETGLRRIIAVCTGIYGLAPTGLLDGRRVTTHWDRARDVEAKFPALCPFPAATPHLQLRYHGHRWR